MMNQSASATRRPSGSTATAGCCPMLVHPQFFVNPFSTQTPLPPPPTAQQCLLGAQAPQLSLPTTAITNAPQANQPTTVPVSNSNVVPTNSTVSTNITNGNSNNNPTSQHQQPSQQQPQQQPQASRQDHSNYSTSLSAHPFPLQHLLASRYPANCMALAAALASASFHQHQQLQQVHQQQLQQAPINHPQPPATNASSTGGPLSTPPTSTTNQVPLLNFNSYNAAQPFLNIPAPAPLAAHLNLSNNHHQQPTNTANSNTAPSAPHSTNNTGNHVAHQPISGHRPLATNTTLNSAANQQPTNNFRTAPQQPQVQQQLQLNLGGRNSLNDEALNTIFTDHFQAIILNQLLGNPQFAPSVVPVPPINSSRPQQQHVSPTPSGPAAAPTVAPSAQPQPSQNATSGPQQPQQQPAETNVVDLQRQTQQPPTTFQSVSQTTAQTRMSQAPTIDAYSSSTTNTGNMYQQQTSEPVTLQAQQSPQQQQQQQPQPIPPIPFYQFPQVEQALALLANPQVANNIFSQVFNMYFQGIRSESNHTHHHHHQPHHYHHHLHGSHHHHHHHHGPNGQNNGQDDTMLTISESKPRGLNRAEIDSLTPYIQMNEKDSRTCVICLSRFELKSKIRPLPCNHAFHAKCVDKWLRANRTCPICRRDALKTYGAKIKRI